MRRLLLALWYGAQIAGLAWLGSAVAPDGETGMAWVQALLGILGSLLGAGGSIYGGEQAEGAVPNQHDLYQAGFDPRADPLLALLTAYASSGLGFAPDPNLIQAGSPVNRLENALLNSLGRRADGRDLREMNAAIQAANQALASGGDASAVEDAFMQFRGQEGRAFYDVAKAAIAAGGDIAGTISENYAAGSGSKPGLQSKIQAALEAGAAAGFSGTDLARYMTDEVIKGEKLSEQAGLFRTALSSAGFDNMEDLIAQEQEFRAKAEDTTQRLGGLAESRFGARESANLTIDRLLRDYPAYGASDIERESMLALEPYQAQELEQANMLGYNPATNLALTRQAGIRDALSILSGRQGLTNTSLMALRNELGQQTGEALATSGQTGAAMANAANLASQQALALNQLGMQGAMYQGGALGGATGAAGAYLQNMLLNLGQPGTGGNSYFGNGRGGGWDEG